MNNQSSHIDFPNDGIPWVTELTFFRSKRENFPDTASSKYLDVFSNWTPNTEGVLVIVPHDDDAVLGIGMLLEKFIRDDIPCRLVITTDGRMGYVIPEHRGTVASVRRRETMESYSRLGFTENQITFLDFPENNLTPFRGRRWAQQDESPAKDGVIGLEDAYVRVLREPVLSRSGNQSGVSRVFIPSRLDYHNDHIVVAEQVAISIFHASGGIWPECGPTLNRLPYLYEFSVYTDFPESNPPNILVVGTRPDFETKLSAIQVFESQGQIAQLITNVERDGPIEMLCEVPYRLVDRRIQLRNFFANKQYLVRN